jgi:hypothetical protein
MNVSTMARAQSDPQSSPVCLTQHRNDPKLQTEVWFTLGQLIFTDSFQLSDLPRESGFPAVNPHRL